MRLGQETPAACPSCSSAVPGAAHMQAWPVEDTSQGGSREPQTRHAQHEKLNSPCSYSQGALRQTTAAAPALMLDETESNHTRITTPSPSYWICSHSPRTNIQIFPPWSFIWSFTLPWVFHPVPFSSHCPPCYCLELLGNTYSAKGSSCKSFNSRPPASVERASRCPLSSRYTLPPGDIRASVMGGPLHSRGEVGGAL